MKLVAPENDDNKARDTKLNNIIKDYLSTKLKREEKPISIPGTVLQKKMPIKVNPRLKIIKEEIEEL